MKRFHFFLIVLGLMLVLSACGNGNDNSKDDNNDNGNSTSDSQNTETENGDERSTVDEGLNQEGNPSKLGPEQSQGAPKEIEGGLELVTVDLKNNEGKKVGTVNLEETDAGVRISLEASDLPPGIHGFHIHETGSCVAPTFESAGSHYNPTNTSHGVDNEKGPHVGDLPNIEVGKDGTIKEEITAKNVTLKMHEENSLFDSDGSALVIHAKADDNNSQPSGDAGDRIACSEIGE